MELTGAVMKEAGGEKSFFERVYEVVARVPTGSVASYGQIARMLGRPQAAREVGWAMRHCPEGLPWQRIVRSDGSVSGGGCAEIRRAKLREEGVRFLSAEQVDMIAHQWDG